MNVDHWTSGLIAVLHVVSEVLLFVCGAHVDKSMLKEATERVRQIKWVLCAL